MIVLNECAVNRLLSVCSNYASLCCDKNDHYDDDDENSIGYLYNKKLVVQLRKVHWTCILFYHISYHYCSDRSIYR